MKIRGWHSKMRRMISCEEMVADQMALLPDGRFINVHGADTRLSTIFNPKEFVPLLSTGEVDVDGVEIYAGDILKIGPMLAFEEGCHEVVFVRAGFWAGGVSGHNFKYCKVVGNIYENKELLK